MEILITIVQAVRREFHENKKIDGFSDILYTI